MCKGFVYFPQSRDEPKEKIMEESTLDTRFPTAADGAPPTDEQREAVKQIRNATINLAAHIEGNVPSSRNKSLALTALEDVQMRANRGIFQD